MLVFDDLKADAGKFARTLFRSIGIDPTFEPSLLDRKYGHRKKRGRALWSQIQEWSMRVSRASDVAAQVIRWCRRQGLTEWIHRLRPGNEYPPLTDTVRERLCSYYRDDVNRLRSYLDRDLPGWPGTVN